MKWIYAIVVSVSLFMSPVFAADVTHNEVTGLKIPAPQVVNFDEGYVTLTAECKGTVKWLVLSTSTKLKYKIGSATPNEIDIAVPPYEGVITVFCVGLVDNKQTEFARTDIEVKGSPTPNPDPPTPADIKSPFHLSIIEDPQKRTQAVKSIVENTQLFAKLRDKKITPRVYTINDPVVKLKKFDIPLQTYGAPLLILQDDTGKALVIGKLPDTPADLLKLVGQFVGGF